MNKPAKMADMKPAGISPEEWQARVDLAAVYRLIAHYGWDDVIYNHSSMRVPGEPRMFLMKKHDLLYTEVTASNLVKVSMDADLDEKSGVNRPGFTLHGGVLACAGRRQLRDPRPHRYRHGVRRPEERPAHAVAAGDPLLQAYRLSRLRRHHRGFRRARADQQGSRPEPRHDHAQSRHADRRQDRARSLRADVASARSRRTSS